LILSVRFYGGTPEMADIRQRVEEDMGLLKKIQSFVPGFRGYRKREDLRDADRMLRMQLVDRLGRQRKRLEDSRTLITKSFDSKPLDLLGGLISQFKKVEGEVLHAEMGYSGFVADLEVKENELNRLYEFDAGMFADVMSIAASIDALQPALSSQDDGKSIMTLNEMRTKIAEFEDFFNRRMLVITGSEV